MSGHQHLVQMANDIGNFFAAEPDHAAAVDGVAGHIRRYWEPRMRRNLFAMLDAGGEGFSPIARDAVKQLIAQARAEKP